MPAPSTPLAVWASDATHDDPGTAWDGQPNKVEPSAGELAAGFLPARKPAAEWLNWILNVLASWVLYFAGFFDPADDEFIYPATKTRTLILCPSGAVKGSAPFGTHAGEPGWKQSSVGSGTESAAESRWSGAELIWDLHRVLPTGAVLTQVDALVTPGATAVSNQTMQLYINEAEPNFSVETTGEGANPMHLQTDVDGESSATLHTFSLSGLTYEIEGTKNQSLRLRARVDAAAPSDPVEDLCHSVRLTFTDPGPRNF